MNIEIQGVPKRSVQFQKIIIYKNRPTVKLVITTDIKTQNVLLTTSIKFYMNPFVARKKMPSGVISGAIHANPILWGYAKDIVHRTNVNSVMELKQKIQTAVASVDVSILKHSGVELEYRLDIVRATKGSYVELY